MLRKASLFSPTPHGGTASPFGMADLHSLRLLLGPSVHFMTDGESGGSGPSEAPRLTEAEWKARRTSELAEKSHAELAVKVATLESDNRDLRANQVPKGARVLTADELKDWDAYVALGKPAEVAQTVKDGQDAIVERDTLKASTLIQSAAKVAGADETVLGDRLKASGLIAETRDVTVDGKSVSQVFLKDAAGKDLGELRTYADSNWKPYAAALFPVAGTQTQAVQTAQAGIVITPQAGAGAGSGTAMNPVEARIAARTQATKPVAAGGTP